MNKDPSFKDFNSSILSHASLHSEYVLCRYPKFEITQHCIAQNLPNIHSVAHMTSYVYSGVTISISLKLAKHTCVADMTSYVRVYAIQWGLCFYKCSSSLMESTVEVVQVLKILKTKAVQVSFSFFKLINPSLKKYKGRVSEKKFNFVKSELWTDAN